MGGVRRKWIDSFKKRRLSPRSRVSERFGTLSLLYSRRGRGSHVHALAMPMPIRRASFSVESTPREAVRECPRNLEKPEALLMKPTGSGGSPLPRLKDGARSQRPGKRTPHIAGSPSREADSMQLKQLSRELECHSALLCIDCYAPGLGFHQALWLTADEISLLAMLLREFSRASKRRGN